MDKTRLKIAFLGDSLTEGIVGASYVDLLQDKLPQHEMVNHGRGGETVKSLYRRIQRMEWPSPFDLGVFWIGVNDVLVKTHWFIRIKKRLRAQPWANNHSEFREYFGSLLEWGRDKFSRLFTLPPLFIGEDIDNPWNTELTALADIIQDLTLSDPHAEFIDIRKPFFSGLASIKAAPFIPKGLFRVIVDAFAAPTADGSEKAAGEEGLRYTIDGVHLNKTGAEMVAEFLGDRIENFSSAAL
jgi:lysophospholipase L1-like esterase